MVYKIVLETTTIFQYLPDIMYHLYLCICYCYKDKFVMNLPPAFPSH
jgi:hypothetical protein